jgi:hypothetical protein
MIPDLQASFACEDIRVEASSAHSIVGIINFIGAPALPIRLLKMCVWSRWCSGVGKFRQQTKIICPDETTILGSADTNFSLSNMESHATNINVFAGLEFKQAGCYQVEIWLDSELKLRYPLSVVLPVPAISE